MILQALKEYYDRKAAEGEMAQDGWIKGGIDFIIGLDLQGSILSISDMRELDGKKLVPRVLDLPNIGKQALKHANSGKDANLLWDNASFVFGLGDKGNIRLRSMIEAIDKWIGNTQDKGIMAVRKFLEKGLENRTHFDSALNDIEYGETLRAGNVKLSFHVPQTGLSLVFYSESVVSALERVVEQNNGPDITLGTCLVTGVEKVPIELTHPVTKGVWGAQTSGACIVSFNKDAFNSYDKAQSLNAPVSKQVASQYSKALNALLESSKQCIHIGDASTVFWSEKKSSFESDFAYFFKEPEKDNPDMGVERVKVLFESVNSGAYFNDDGNDRFYILGLAPNSARISVRFWQVGKISEFAERIRQYFEDFAIVKPLKEPEYYSVWRILVNIATQDKSENIPPNLAGDFMRSILNGTPYPSTLLQACLRRIRSDTENRVKPVRAALIKAYLNRYYRFYPNDSHKEVNMQLDINQPSTGYQLGRLFATLEKIQEEANPGINATIRERFYGAACSNPVTVFTNLLRLKNHHLAKMESKGRTIYFERLLGEIMGNLMDFPAHLDLHEQGRFAIGYYHQRQSFFEPKADPKQLREEV
ncbi:MAG: type I-C CRISPR-associated protein Cas8c/Csd1 [Syntrophomonadaceae bacterium]|jgi:CRISPR-associated protein Csd1|nr:type I-C CRISPR-associated protein Cas8c/Csd1 [Syntrophomonadaceae bacterium]